jgi:hypothetical protein
MSISAPSGYNLSPDARAAESVRFRIQTLTGSG